MTIQAVILEQLRQQLLPSEPLEDVSRKFRAELKRNLQTSEKSMLVGGIIARRALRKEAAEACRSENAYHEVLAIDFGGSTLKFALVCMPLCNIAFQDGFDITSRLVDQKFFDIAISWIWLKLNEYLAGRDDPAKLLVSITFSFPLNEKDQIITMGKGFQMAPEVQGKSVKKLITLSFQRILADSPKARFEVEICNVINDSAAVYLASKFMCKNESLSLILGTGVNSCFELPLSAMPHKKRPTSDPSNYNCLVNVEAGFLGNGIINITPFDSHGDGERNMPLEDVTAGKWLPMALANILKKYKIEGIDSRTIDGELFVAIVEGRHTGKFTYDNLGLVREISKLLIQRGAFYVVAMLLAVGGLMDQHSAKAIEVGFVGSFLANSQYYQEQIALYAHDRLHFQFLHNSNLLGAAVATYMNKFT